MTGFNLPSMARRWEGYYQYDPSREGKLAVHLNAKNTGSISAALNIVSQWGNLGDQGVGHAVQATGAQRPKYVASAINGRPAIEGRHDGVNASNLAIADATGLDYTLFTSFTVFQRVTDLAVTAEQIAGKYSTSGNQRESRVLLNNTDYLSSSVSTDGTSGTLVSASMAASPTVVGTPAIAVVCFTGSSLKISKNGANEVSAAVASVFNGTSPYYLFSRDSNGDPYAGYIGEHLFFTELLDAAAQARVLAYLQAGWGL